MAGDWIRVEMEASREHHRKESKRMRAVLKRIRDGELENKTHIDWETKRTWTNADEYVNMRRYHRDWRREYNDRLAGRSRPVFPIYA